MTLRSYMICLFAGLFNLLLANSEQYIFKHLTTEQGLSQSEVRAIVKDKYGFMWFGTTDGLNCYDGYEFKVYKNENSDIFSLKNNSIKKLYTDRFGRLWVGTIQGLCLFDRNSNRFLNYTEDQDGNKIESSINTIAEDSEGNMWFVCQAGVFRFLSENLDSAGVPTRFKRILEINAEDIETMADGSLVIGSWSSLIRIDKEHLSDSIISEDKIAQLRTLGDIDLNTNGAVAICENADKTLWIGTSRSGLLLYKPPWAFPNYGITKRFHKGDSSGLKSNFVIEVCKDINGEVWAGTQNGLYKVTKEQDNYVLEGFFYDKYNSDGLDHNNIDELYFDNSGIMWIGTMGGGVNLIDFSRKKFSKHEISSGADGEVTSGFIRALREDRNQNIWMGTFDRKIIRFNPYNENYTYHNNTTPNVQLQGTQVFDVATLYGNRLVIGTIGQNGGVYMYSGIDKEKGELKKISNERAFVVQPYGENIWIGGWNKFGVLRPDESGNYDYTRYDMSPNNPVRAIVKSHTENCLWIGTLTQRLVKAKLNQAGEPEQFFHFIPQVNDTNSISSNTVRDLYQASNGTLWVGTNNGLSKIREIVNDSTIYFTSFSVKDGLPNNRIQAVQEDGMGRIWVSTVRGLSRYNAKDNTFSNYDVNDGLKNNEFVESSRMIASDGKLYFGNINGFTSFYPEEIIENEFNASPKLTKLYLNNTEYLPGDKLRDKVLLNKSVYELDKLKLSWREKVISIQFSAMHYSSPERNRYRYKLEGFDKEWIETSAKKRSVTYTNLPKGRYTFSLMASNNDGIWNQSEVSLPIRIKPPFWNTWVFYILIITLIIYGVYRFIMYREQESRRNKAILEDKLKEGEKVLQEKLKEIDIQQDEIEKRAKIEADLNYLNQGLAKFIEILGKNKNNIAALSNDIIVNLVEYVEVEHGLLFLINDTNEEDKFLEVKGSYGSSAENLIRESVRAGEGYVGTCYYERKTITVNNIPEDYIKVGSGLGEDIPKILLFVPIQHDSVPLGVVELSSFHELPKNRVEFVERLCANIASVISIEKANL